MRVGERLARRFELEARLGEGGMGEVWRALDLSLDRRVAVKLLLANLDGGEADARFRREARIGARLLHPGITVVHDVGEHEGQLFLVMELLKGADLGAVLAASPGRLLPLGRALDLLTQVAEALAVAHEQSVVHRDLKPANLFVQPGDRVKICDFGIARAAGEARLTGSGWVLGTAAYMAPEQCRGEDVGPSADLYSLGCVLHELLVGTPPFGQGAPVSLAVRHVLDPAPELSAGTTADAGPAGPDLARLLTELLAKQPDARPESAGVVAGRLRQLAARVVGRTERGVPHQATVRDPSPGLGAFGPPPGLPGAITPPASVAHDLARALLEEAVGLMTQSEGPFQRSEILAAAADAAARFDADMALRFLAKAEQAVWEPRFATSRSERLGELARRWASGSRVRAARLLSDAEQALAAASEEDRERGAERLQADMEDVQAILDPEFAVRKVEREGRQEAGSRRVSDRMLRHAVLAVADRDPERGEAWLARITDYHERNVALVGFARAYAARDLPTAVELVSGLKAADVRAEALCTLAGEAWGARPEQRQAALARAEEAVARVVGDWASYNRAQAADHVREGRLTKASEAAGRAEAMELALSGKPGPPFVYSPLIAALIAARGGPTKLQAPVLDVDEAKRQAEGARRLPHAVLYRARALVSVARSCSTAPDSPWLPEVAQDPGVTARPQPVAYVPSPAQHPPGHELWHTSVAMDGVWAASPNRVVCQEGLMVRAYHPETGSPCWQADADIGVNARRSESVRRISICGGDGVVYVVVEGNEGTVGVRLVARDAQDGWIHWWVDLPNRIVRSDSLLLLHDGMLFHTDGDSAVCLDPVTGRVLEESCVGMPFRTIAAPPGRATQQARPEGFGPFATNLLRTPESPTGLSGESRGQPATRAASSEWPWLFGTDVVPTPESAPRMLTDAGRRYATRGTRDLGDEVAARQLGGGPLLWTRRLTSRTGERCALQLIGVTDNALYVQAADGGRNWRGRRLSPFVAALDVRSGRELWRWEHAGISHRPAALVGNRLVLALPELTALAVGGESRGARP
ncbi:protein kinase [Streptomyces yangpuensis]|uniref:serine/threonine protein kinase n=1 Tax=Streptomyces yangpuensis TaxID=1648182 RepID=UPI0038060ACA